MEKTQSLDTICIQGGWKPKNGESRVLPIYQSTTFKYETSEQMGRLFDLEEDGYFYTRLANPTNDAVAEKICQLEGGVARRRPLPDRQAIFTQYLHLLRRRPRNQRGYHLWRYVRPVYRNHEKNGD